jgi:hypothetical protein
VSKRQREDKAVRPTDDSGRAGTTTPPGLDELVERTERVQREAAALRERHRKMSERIAAATGGATPRGRAAPSPAPKRRPEREAPDAAETVRLVVTDLALTGANRETADTHLRETLGSEDHQEILDEVFGSEAGGRRRRRFRRRT